MKLLKCLSKKKHHQIHEISSLYETSVINPLTQSNEKMLLTIASAFQTPSGKKAFL